jgi:4-amino-4-deoxy-L-arabinose transferase-like glycosyltransferase
MINEEVRGNESGATRAANFEDRLNILNNKYIYVLLVLIGIGVFLRFYHLGFNSLWLDESLTYYNAKNSFIGMWNATWNMTINTEYNPPLFFWIEHVMLQFGTSESVLRFIPAIFGIATIPLVYVIGKEISDKNVGVVAAAFVAFNPFHIYYSQEARVYTMMVFLVGLAFLFLMRGIKERNTASWVWLGISSALAFWAHYYALIPICIFFAFAYVYTWVRFRKVKQDFKRISYGLLTFIITGIPLFIVMVRTYFKMASTPPTWGYHGFKYVTDTLLQISAGNVYIMYFFLGLFCIGAVVLFRQDKGKFLLLLAFLIIPLAVTGVLSYKISLASRYLLYLLPGYLVGIAISCKAILTFIRSKYVIYGFIVLSMLLLIPYSINYYTKFSKQDWHGVSNYLQEMAKSQDYVVLIPSYVHLPFDYYYHSQSRKVTEFQADTVDKLEQIRSSSENNSIYYVVTDNIYALNSKRDMLNWLKKNTKLISSYNEIRVYK